MMKKKVQYTVRAVPEEVDKALRDKAVREGCSLNTYLVDTLKNGAGLTDTPPSFHDLDHLAGKWISDPECDKALKEFDKIDEDMWK
jgi:hypothetical protein